MTEPVNFNLKFLPNRHQDRIADILATKVYEDDNTSVLLDIQRGVAADNAAS